MRIPFAPALVVLTLLTSACLAPAGAAEESEFLTQVRSQFDTWDLDHDKALSADEIERVVNDPKVKGKSAAAAASLRRGIRSDRSVKALTLEQIRTAVTSSTDTPKPPKYEAMYSAAVEHIAATDRSLFANGLPKNEVLCQGKLGDCFLLATLGTVAATNPERFKTIFKPLPEGKVEVSFAACKPFVMDMPTDAEICIASRNHNDGMWAITFEKAIGTVLLERQTTKKHLTPLSIIGVGGSPATVMSILTGHKSRRLGCEDFQTDKLTNPLERATRLAEIRKALLETQVAGRIIVGGTAPISGKQVKVPGLYYNHSYGILGYDHNTDTVTFWNPFGNAYTPKGEPGLKTGYKTEHGKFTMPLADAVMWFGSFSIETTEPWTP